MTIKRKLDLVPDVKLLDALAHSGHDLEEAGAELIDNSVDAKNEDGVTIDITVSNDKIMIIDDGIGMDFEGLQNALTLARSKKDSSKLGKFGLGLKTAGFGMGMVLEITTKKAGVEYEYYTKLDLNEMLERGEWLVECEERPAKIDQHGTKIVITDLKIKSPLSDIDDVIQKLQMRFGHILENKEDNIHIYINDEELEPLEIEVSHEEGIWTPIHEETNFGTITGWASLMPKGSQAGAYYGIHCYWHNRLIMPFNKIGFKPHASVARIFGKINLDFVDVQHDKKSFLKKTIQYQEAEEAMAIALKELLKKAKKPTGVKPTKPTKLPKEFDYYVSKGITNYGLKNFSIPENMDRYTGSSINQITAEVKEVFDQEVSEDEFKSVEIINGKRINYVHSFKDLGKDANYLIYDYNPDNNCLRVVSNTDNSIYEMCKDTNFLYYLHSAEGIARFILSSQNKSEDIDEYFKLFSSIFESLCACKK